MKMVLGDVKTDYNQEIKILKETNSPNIIKFYEAFNHQVIYICIVTEYCNVRFLVLGSFFRLAYNYKYLRVAI